VWNNCTQYCKTNRDLPNFMSCVDLSLKDIGLDSGQLHLGVSCGKTSGQGQNRVNWGGSVAVLLAILVIMW
jgi:hypothetical protein